MVFEQEKPKTEKGFTLLEVVISLGLISMVIFSVSSMTMLVQNMNSQIAANNAAEEVRYQIVNAIRDEKSWSATLNHTENNEFNCIRNLSMCANIERSFSVFNNAGEKLADGANNSSYGFSYNGKFCDTFSNQGNSECPFQFKLVWTPECPAGETNCIDPIIRIKGKLAYYPSENTKNYPIKTSKFDINAVRESALSSKQSLCNTLGGTFNLQSQECDVNPADSIADITCPAGSVLTGIDNTGAPVCKTLQQIAGTCPGGTYMIGFQANGQALCSTNPVYGQNCGGGQFIRAISATGVVQCVSP